MDDVVMDDLTSNLLIQVFNRHWEDYSAHLKRCRQEASEEAVHDLRVVIRRCATLAELLRVILPQENLQKLRRNLKNQLDDLDELRDTQVLIVEVTDVLDALPQAELYLAYLEKREKKLLRLSGKRINQFKPGGLSKPARGLRKSLVLFLQNEPEADRFILATMDEFYAAVARQNKSLDVNRTATIHRLRIAFRKFRYLAETFAPIITDFPSTLVASMQDYQDQMGAVHDLEILIESLQEFASKTPDFDLKTVLDYFSQQYQIAIRTFFKNHDQVKQFWRSSTRANFPWKHTIIKTNETAKKKENVATSKKTFDLDGIL